MIPGALPFEPLWANIEQFITAAVVIFFIVISIIGNIISKINEQAAQAKKRAAGQRPKAPAAGGGSGVEDEITEFLRRAAEGKAEAEPQRPRQQPQQQQQRQPQRQQQRQQQQRQQQRQQRPQRRRQQTPRRPVEQAVSAEVVQEPGRAPVGSGLSTGEVAQHAEHLGDDVAAKDQQFDQMLQSKFDHDVGQLGDTPGGSLPPTAAAGFGALLADANSIRQAIILSEILNRPEDRWET